MAGTAHETPSKTPPFLGTLALVAVAIAALFSVDMFLARLERRESQAEGRRLIQQGQRLAQQGRHAEAIDRFRSALSVSRGNREAQLGLAGALLAVGRLTDAESLLREMLQRNATDGEANLALARVLAARSRTSEAASYYRQAIFGRWSGDTRANRVQVRFELIDLLVRQGAHEEVLAELLPLQEEAPDDLQTRKRIARLYLSAGAPSRAIALFNEILQQQPLDIDAYAGIGEAEFARGNYRTARTNFQLVLGLNPADTGVRKRLAVSDAVLALDPTRRGLSAAERHRRSVAVVELTVENLRACMESPPPEALRDLIDKAGQSLKRRVSSSQRDEATEANLSLAEQLWRARAKVCRGSPGASDEPLALVISRLAQ